MGIGVLKLKYITRQFVRANPDKLFLFGDNLECKGYGGQAAAMRGEPNAIGIPTKKSPSFAERAFFTDEEFALNKAAIDASLSKIFKALESTYSIVVIPVDGLGTGRAQLDKRARRTFAYLQQQLTDLETFLG